MTGKPSFYITTAISYVNAAPHLGHAYEAILTDVMARFKRLDGYDVMFLTGTDEHGEKVANTAQQAGKTPEIFVDEIAAHFEKMCATLNISNDDFIRTTQERHHKASQALWRKIQANGDIYLDTYKGWYSVRDEAYVGDDEIETDENGNKFAPSGAPVEWREEPSYFFRLSAYTQDLLDFYEQNPAFIAPQKRRNEVLSFVKGGLRDISISRTGTRWGVPVPDDPDHVMYVWLDALTNYITALGYPDMSDSRFQTYWPANFHVIGKDITRFHAVYWPAFLMSAGIANPHQIFAHGFINVEGQKMSKSVGNVVAPDDLVGTFGCDQTRYLLVRETPHGQDGNFSAEHAIQRINSDLANSIGNLAQRTLSMIYKNCNGKIPAGENLQDEDWALLNHAHEHLLPALRTHFETFALHKCMEEIIKLADAANSYIDAQAPWVLKKENPQRMGEVLYTLAETIRVISIALQSAAPEGASKILDQLNIPTEQRYFSHINANNKLQSGQTINKPEAAFPRLEMPEESRSA